MTTYYHTPWTDGSTEYKQADMRPPLGELDQAIRDLHSIKLYDYAGQYIGATPTNGQLLMRALIARFQVIKAGDGRSQLTAVTAATGSSTFNIKKETAAGAISAVGTAVVSPAGKIAVVTVGSDVSFNKGDHLRLEAPATADATLQDLSWNIVLTRQDGEFLTTTTTSTTTTTTTTMTTTTTTTTSTTTTV